MMRWAIYYGPDDEMITSEYVTPFRIKRRTGIQVIAQESKDHGWRTLSGRDYYIWDERGGEAQWFGGDIFGLHHYLLQPGFKCVLFGVEIDKHRFYDIFNRARDEFDNKEVFAVGERHPDG